MNDLPNKLDPRIKTVWRLSAAIVVTLCYAAGLLALLPLCLELGALLPLLPLLPYVPAWLVTLILCCGPLPAFRYAQWAFAIGEHELEIRHGIFWRTRTLVPYIRMQDTNTQQGPVMRAFGLASITVSTAAGNHVIPGIDASQAEHLCAVIATQARLAREEQR